MLFELICCCPVRVWPVVGVGRTFDSCDGFKKKGAARVGARVGGHLFGPPFQPPLRPVGCLYALPGTPEAWPPRFSPIPELPWPAPLVPTGWGGRGVVGVGRALSACGCHPVPYLPHMCGSLLGAWGCEPTLNGCVSAWDAFG